jgi:hypothetical protein
MKTAIQELLTYILVDCRNESGAIQFNAHETFNKFLEKEKEQIIDFHVMLMKNGLEQEGNIIEWDYNELKQEALEFYNQTYNQNK